MDMPHIKPHSRFLMRVRLACVASRRIIAEARSNEEMHHLSVKGPSSRKSAFRLEFDFCFAKFSDKVLCYLCSSCCIQLSSARPSLCFVWGGRTVLLAQRAAWRIRDIVGNVPMQQ